MHCFLRCRHGSGSTEPHAAPRSLRALPPNRVPLFFLQCVHDCTSGIDSCNKTTFGTAHILLRECVHSLCRCWPRCEHNTGYLRARYCSPLFLKKKFPNAMMSQLWFLSFVSDLLFCCFQYLLQISDTFPPAAGSTVGWHVPFYSCWTVGQKGSCYFLQLSGEAWNGSIAWISYVRSSLRWGSDKVVKSSNWAWVCKHNVLKEKIKTASVCHLVYKRPFECSLLPAKNWVNNSCINLLQMTSSLFVLLYFRLYSTHIYSRSVGYKHCLHIAYAHVDMCRNPAENTHTSISQWVLTHRIFAESVHFLRQCSSTGQPAVSPITQHPPGVRSAICRWVAGCVDGGMTGEKRERERGGLKRKRGNRITGSADIWNVFRRVSESCGVWTLLRGIQLAVTWLRKWLFESVAAQGKDRETHKESCILQKCLQGCFTKMCFYPLFVISFIIRTSLIFSVQNKIPI